MFEAAVASYSLMTGIQVIYSWKFFRSHDSQNSIDFISNPQLQNNANNPTLNFFRTMLMNAFQHDEQYFKTFPTTEINDRNSNMKVIASLFKPSLGQKTQAIYAFAFFINEKYQTINTVINDLVRDSAVECAMLIQNALRKDEQLYTVTSKIHDCAYQISCIFRAGVDNIHSISSVIESNNQDQVFYAQVLWCHLYTQMTTIIELDDSKPGAEIPLFNFLASFMLPFQLQLSDIKPHKEPIPGFFLQCVVQQKGLPKETLLMFKRPWTWIRISEKKVICIENIEEHKSFANQYLQTIKLNFDFQPSDAKERLKKKEIDIIKRDGFMVKWPLKIMNLLKKVPDHLRVTFAREILNELLQKAVILIQAINLILKQKQQNFLNPSQLKDICSTFNIEDDEKEIILSIANLFDSSILNRTDTYRTQMLKHIIEST